MKDPMDQLQQVRSLREHLARTDLARGRHRLDQADQELSHQQADLERHRLFQVKMEALLFEEIGRKTVTLNEFETYRGRISDLRTEEKNCRERVREAEIHKDSAHAEVDRLGVVFQNRCRESTRLKEFRNARDTRREEEKNRRAEEEMEEMAINRFPCKDEDS